MFAAAFFTDVEVRRHARGPRERRFPAFFVGPALAKQASVSSIPPLPFRASTVADVASSTSPLTHDVIEQLEAASARLERLVTSASRTAPDTPDALHRAIARLERSLASSARDASFHGGSAHGDSPRERPLRAVASDPDDPELIIEYAPEHDGDARRSPTLRPPQAGSVDVVCIGRRPRRTPPSR